MYHLTFVATLHRSFCKYTGVLPLWGEVLGFGGLGGLLKSSGNFDLPTMAQA